MVVTNCTLRGVAALQRIVITGDRVTAITAEATAPPIPPGEEVIDAAGGLVTEPFVNGHLHLCKVHTLDSVGDGALTDYHGSGMGGAMTAIEAAAEIKKQYHRERLLPGIRHALEQAVVHGISHVRAFADTDSTARLEGIAAVMQGRDEFAPLLTVQAVAFPQDGIVRDPPAAEVVRQALEMGADVVGGIPWIELTREDELSHITQMMDLAQEFDRDVSMLVDDAGDAGLRTLELLAVETDRRQWHRRVTAQHARAMALYPEPYLRKVIALLQRAQIGIISDPHTGPLHAPVQTLRAAGVPVGLGQDDITDAYYPFGRNNMLEVAFLCAHILWMTSAAGLEDLYDMITTDAARVLNLSPHEYGLAPAGPGDLVIHQHRGIRDILREHAPPAVVIHGGKIVAADGQLTPPGSN